MNKTVPDAAPLREPVPLLFGVVLTGGQSSRMGTDKSTLIHPDGGTFLQHAVKRLAAIIPKVCVAGKCDQPIQDNICVLPDPVAYAGPVTGVISALEFLRSQDNVASIRAVLVTPVDMPWLKASDLRELVTAWQRNDKLSCLVNQADGRLQPLVAIYSIDHLEPLRKLASSDDRSLYRWIQTQDHQTVAADDQSCRNVNSPDDFEV